MEETKKEREKKNGKKGLIFLFFRNFRISFFLFSFFFHDSISCVVSVSVLRGASLAVLLQAARSRLLGRRDQDRRASHEPRKHVVASGNKANSFFSFEQVDFLSSFFFFSFFIFICMNENEMYIE